MMEGRGGNKLISGSCCTRGGSAESTVRTQAVQLCCGDIFSPVSRSAGQTAYRRAFG